MDDFVGKIQKKVADYFNEKQPKHAALRFFISPSDISVIRLSRENEIIKAIALYLSDTRTIFLCTVNEKSEEIFLAPYSQSNARLLMRGDTLDANLS